MWSQITEIKNLSKKSPVLSLLAALTLLIVSHAIIMIQPNSRMYWPYMLISYLLASVVWYFNQARYGKSLENYLFSKKMWLHPSALNDYKLFIFNYVIFFNFIAYTLLNIHIIEDYVYALLDALGVAQADSAPGIIACIIYTVSVLLLTELAYYALHRAYHEFPFLWELHKVHHSAEVMTPITYIRAHPVDLLLQGFMRLSSILLCSGVFLYLYPNKDGLITVGSLDAGLFVYYLTGAAIHHSHIWIRFGDKLEHVFISPAQHQVHHSANPKHFDKNYGSMLAIWDWMFGSLYIPEKYEKIDFGLSKKEQKDYETTTQILWVPMKSMFLIAYKKMFGTKRL